MSKAAELAKWGEVSTNGQVSGRRNLVINGAMQVAQRATSASAGNDTCVSLDRHRTFVSGGGAYTLSQETDTPSGQGFKNSMKVTVSTADSSIAAGDYYIIQHRIEGQNVAHFMLGTSSAVKVTLSFWVKSSLTGNFGGSFLNSDNNRSYPFQYNISTANTWEKITKTVQLDTTGTWLTTNGIGFKIYFDLGSGTTYQGTADAWAGTNYHTASSSVQLIGTNSATWYVTGLQLEVGSVATPFEHRSYGEELQLCRRYLQYFDAHSNYDRFAIGTATTTDDCNFLFKFNPYMRDVPTLVHGTLSEIVVLDNDNSAEAIGSLSIDTNTDGPQGCNVEASDITSDVMTAGDATQMSANNTANAFISFDSEL